MKKIISLLIILFSTISLAHASGLNISLKQCLRYGTNVVLVFNVSNQTGSDQNIIMHNTRVQNDEGDNGWSNAGIYVFDPDGNYHYPSEITYGTVKEQHINTIFDLPVVPLGSNTYYNALNVPDGVNLQIRVAVMNIPTSVQSFQTIQIRGKVVDGKVFCLNYSAANGNNLSITTMQ